MKNTRVIFPLPASRVPAQVVFHVSLPVVFIVVTVEHVELVGNALAGQVSFKVLNQLQARIALPNIEVDARVRCGRDGGHPFRD